MTTIPPQNNADKPTPTLRCCVLDDEPLACRLVASYVQRTPFLELVGAFTEPSKALERIANGDIDLAFLDIHMPQISGMDIARQIPPATRVVFITAYSVYAVEGFRVNAIDYLLKPVSYADFMQAADRARLQMLPPPTPTGHDADAARRQGAIVVKSERRQIRIQYHTILYIEGLKDYVKIYISGQQHPILTLMSMKALEQALPADMFMRVHRSFIINTLQAQIIQRGHIVINNTEIPISDSYKAAFIRRFNA
ncbi:MAG: LytR/AlgR family response regulator transcription factor [Muribaculaceae bacterium]